MRARPEVDGWLSRWVCRRAPAGTRTRQNVTRAPRPHPRSTVSPPPVTCTSSSKPDQTPTLAPPVATGRASPIVCARAPPRIATRPFMKPAFRADGHRPALAVRTVSRGQIRVGRDRPRPASMHGLWSPAHANAHQAVGLELQPAPRVPVRCNQVAHRHTQAGSPNVGHHAHVGIELGLAVEIEVAGFIQRRAHPVDHASRDPSRTPHHPQRAAHHDRIADGLRHRDAQVPGRERHPDKPGIRILSDDIRRSCSGRHCISLSAARSSSRRAPGAPPRTLCCGCATREDRPQRACPRPIPPAPYGRTPG